MLETGILTALWDTIVQRMNKTSKLLQSSTLDVNTAAFLLHSLKDFIESLRTEFSLFEEQGMMLSKIEVYKEEEKESSVRRRISQGGMLWGPGSDQI